jgi:hypothetical protein
MATGPVQLIIIGFDTDDNLHGQIKRELDAIRGRGVIRLIDALMLRKDYSGNISVYNVSDATLDDLAEYRVALKRLIGDESLTTVVHRSEHSSTPPMATDDVLTSAFGISTADVQSLVGEIAPGSAVALALFEHSWASAFSEAVRGAGGHLVAQGILTRDAVFKMGAELEAIAEAERAIEAAKMIKSVALLDALTFRAEMEQIRDDAISETVAAIADGEIRTVVAAETLRTLVDAGVIDDSEFDPALAALVEAGLLDRSVVEQTVEAGDAS